MQPKYESFRSKTGKSHNNLPEAKIRNWVDRHFKCKPRKNGQELLICNPFDGDTSYKFNINPSKGVCHDWRGDEYWAGPINPETGNRNCSFIKFVRLYKKCSYREALQDILGDTEDVSAFLRPDRRVTDSEAQKKVSVTLPAGVELLSNSHDTQSTILKKWLISRGYTEDDIAKYELYSLGMDVYWPYYEFDSLVYYQSRSRLNKRFSFPPLEIYDEAGKIVGVTDGGKSDFLYGFDEVEPASYAIITEAIFGQYTVGAQALASGGAVLTDNQVQKLKIIGPRHGVILAPDNDKAGLKSIKANIDILARQGLSAFFSIPPRIGYEKDGKTEYTKDWNELITGLKMTRIEVRKILDDNIQKANRKSLINLNNLLRSV